MSVLLLAIDTATPACSVALFEDQTLIASEYEEIGRGHAERIVPMIAGLPEKGRSDKIVVNCGPGSFTGVRIGISVARALGFAWQAQLSGYQCLHLVAAQSIETCECPSGLSVAMNGGHGEYFVQNFSHEGLPLDEIRSLTPEAALNHSQTKCFAGTAAEELVARISSAKLISAGFPRASNALLLHDTLRSFDPKPVYGRKPDAIPSKTE